MKTYNFLAIFKYLIISTLLFMYGIIPISKATNEVVINEIAWMGTMANSADEWIELYNNTNQDINLADWKIYEISQADDNTEKQTLIVNLNGTIKANSYYLIERSDDNTITDISANQKPTSWGGSGFNNKGEHLKLLDSASNIVDEINCASQWFAGKASPEYKTMERKNPALSGNDASNWETNNGTKTNGLDIKGNQIQGTPGQQNSVYITGNNSINNTDTSAENNTDDNQTDQQITNQGDNVINNNNEAIQPPVETTTIESSNSPIANNKIVQPTTEIIKQDIVVNPVNANSTQNQNEQPLSAPVASIAKLLAQQNSEQTTPKISQPINSENSKNLSASASTNLTEIKLTDDQATSQANNLETKENKPNQKEKPTLIGELVSVAIIAFLLSLGLIYYRKQKS